MINPVAVLAVAAGLNGLLTIAGKQSPAWLRMMAGAGVGVAMIASLRDVIERKEQEAETGLVAVNPLRRVVDDARYVSDGLVKWY